MEPRILPKSKNPRVPEAPYPFRHSMPLQTRFTDFDMLGHLNNNVYMAFMDMAKADYFTRVIGGSVDWRDPGVVVANTNVDYFAPVFPREPIEVVTTVTRLGQKSIHLDQRILDAETGETMCMATTVMVGFDITTGHSRPIDPQWIEALENYEQRPLTAKSQQLPTTKPE